MRAEAAPLLLLLLLEAAVRPGLVAAEPRPLAVPGFRAASLLLGSRPGPRPLVIGLHGNFDRPEWFCASLEPLLEGRAVALCPRGLPRTDVPPAWDRWTFPNRARLRAEMEAGIGVLRGLPGVTLAEGPILLAGFSLGAIVASRFAVEAPARFPRLYLVEGGQAVWTGAALRRFASQGGRGLLFGCGRTGCAAQSERLCKQARTLGLICRVVTAPGLGHSYTEPLPGLARPAFRELLATDPRFRLRP
jgi:pimeloyl-ACP methyl ester carboxylesterase